MHAEVLTTLQQSQQGMNWVQHRALDSDYVRLFYSCLFHPVAPLCHPGKERPGPYQSPRCKSLVLPGELAAHQLASSAVDTILERAELWETKRLKDVICVILCSDGYSVSESKSPRHVGTVEYFMRLAKTACRQCAISRRSKVYQIHNTGVLMYFSVMTFALPKLNFLLLLAAAAL